MKPLRLILEFPSPWTKTLAHILSSVVVRLGQFVGEGMDITKAFKIILNDRRELQWCP